LVGVFVGVFVAVLVGVFVGVLVGVGVAVGHGFSAAGAAAEFDVFEVDPLARAETAIAAPTTAASTTAMTTSRMELRRIPTAYRPCPTGQSQARQDNVNEWRNGRRSVDYDRVGEHGRERRLCLTRLSSGCSPSQSA
jgi:hypothetical protein